MFKRILVPTDGSEITGRAVATALGLAKALGAEIFTLCVKEPFPYGAVAEMQPTPPQEFFDAQERTATRHVQAVAAACEAAGIVHDEASRRHRRAREEPNQQPSDFLEVFPRNGSRR